MKRIIEFEQLVDELRSRLDEMAEEFAAARASAEQAASAVHASYRRIWCRSTGAGGVAAEAALGITQVTQRFD